MDSPSKSIPVDPPSPPDANHETGTGTGVDGGLELLTTRMQYYEQELMRSLSAIVKNVSEYFQLANGTTTTSSANIATVTANDTSFWSSSTTTTTAASPSLHSTAAPNVTLQEDHVLHLTVPASGLNFGFSNTSSSVFGTRVNWDDVLAQLILLISLTFVLWVVNRRFLRWSTLATVTEVFLSWVVVLVISPLAILLFGPILLARLSVQLYLGLKTNADTDSNDNDSNSNNPHIVLANPFEAVWSFEAPHSPSTCVGLHILEGVCDLERIRTMLHRRMILRQVDGVFVNDCFRRVLTTVGGFIAWERVQHFDIKHHIKYISDRAKNPAQRDLEYTWTEQEVFDEIAAVHETSLCDLHVVLGLREPIPPWEFLVIPKFAYGDNRSCYAIIYRLHHSMLDGISVGNVIHDCVADRPFKFALDPCAPLPISTFTRFIGHIMALINLPRITFSNLFFFERNAFHGRSLTGPKKFGWSRPLKMETLKQIKTITKTSVFAVLFSSIAGSLGKLYAKRVPGKVPKLIHACPPIAILPYPNRYPRNRFSIILYPVLFTAKTALERLVQIFRESKSLAKSPDVLSNYYVVYVLGLMPYPVINLLAPLAHATFTFSNVPGPAEPVEMFGGDRLLEIGAWVPIKNRIGIGSTLFSYHDRLRVTFNADKAALAEPNDVQLLCDGFEDEMSDLALTLQLKCDKLFIDDFDSTRL